MVLSFAAHVAEGFLCSRHSLLSNLSRTCSPRQSITASPLAFYKKGCRWVRDRRHCSSPELFFCALFTTLRLYRKTHWALLFDQVVSDGRLYSVPEGVEMIAPPSLPFLQEWWKVIFVSVALVTLGDDSTLLFTKCFYSRQFFCIIWCSGTF